MAIKITGELYPSTVEGVLADSSFIRGGYITVETISKRNSLNQNSLVDGQPIYVTEENKTYRWDSSNKSWIEDNALATSVTEHINNNSNPHNVTASQLGLENVDNTSDIDKPISRATQEALDNININIQNLQLEKLENSGSQALVGDLIIVKEGESSGSLVIQGDLIVSGTTTTVEHESIAVKDNLIIINSDGNNLGTSLSGTTIKISKTETYGIVYDPINKSVKLGLGVIDDNDLFSFNSGEGLPITVRDSLVNGNIVEWSSSGNKLIDSGIAKSNIATLNYVDDNLSAVLSEDMIDSLF